MSAITHCQQFGHRATRWRNKSRLKIESTAYRTEELGICSWSLVRGLFERSHVRVVFNQRSCCCCCCGNQCCSINAVPLTAGLHCRIVHLNFTASSCNSTRPSVFLLCCRFTAYFVVLLYNLLSMISFQFHPSLFHTFVYFSVFLAIFVFVFVFYTFFYNKYTIKFSLSKTNFNHFFEYIILLMIYYIYVNQVRRGEWGLGDALCDAWVACDVMCCTASILNLAAISVDRSNALHSPVLTCSHLYTLLSNT